MVQTLLEDLPDGMSMAGWIRHANIHRETVAGGIQEQIRALHASAVVSPVHPDALAELIVKTDRDRCR
jgi:hypothetical protein